MKRLYLLVLCLVAIGGTGLTAYLVRAKEVHSDHAMATDKPSVEGPLSNTTVSFGAWKTTPPLDRFPNNSPGGANLNALVPEVAKIKAGGTVNFIIAGFHQVIVYDDGTQPNDINTGSTVPPSMGGPPLINDPNRRIYRGLDPSTQLRDRVEVVQFANPGTYLVICGVLPHFQMGMYGYVKVVP